jgi:hypothetical protein
LPALCCCTAFPVGADWSPRLATARCLWFSPRSGTRLAWGMPPRCELLARSCSSAIGTVWWHDLVNCCMRSRIFCEPMRVPVYEYLVVTTIYRTNWADAQHQYPRPAQTWETTYYIYRPNAIEPEERPGETLLSTVFNDLGQEGWRLVTSDIPDSVVVSGNHYGWTEAGVPVRQRWTFIREARL